jgi:hypothetical protein
LKITETRRFAEAIGSWMHLEACCFRAGLFSESSLKSAIGSVASSFQAEHRGARVHADYPLSSIQRIPDAEKTIGGGRRRRVDFALLYDDGREPASEPQILIETKWAGSSHCTVANLMTDFIRLCLMKRAHPDATCLLVLAGHATDLKKVLSRRPFVGERKDLVRFDGTGTSKKFKFLHRNSDHQKYFGLSIAGFHKSNLDVPIAFSVTGSTPYPAPPARFQALAWELLSVDRQNLCRDEWPASTKPSSSVEVDVVS